MLLYGLAVHAGVEEAIGPDVGTEQVVGVPHHDERVERARHHVLPLDISARRRGLRALRVRVMMMVMMSVPVADAVWQNRQVPKLDHALRRHQVLLRHVARDFVDLSTGAGQENGVESRRLAVL
jgi:hypothetical protein